MALIQINIANGIATVTMNRPEKRNAVSNASIQELGAFFFDPPRAVKAVVLTGSGGHYCAGLDLEEHKARSAVSLTKLASDPGSDSVRRAVRRQRHERRGDRRGA